MALTLLHQTHRLVPLYTYTQNTTGYPHPIQDEEVHVMTLKSWDSDAKSVYTRTFSSDKWEDEDGVNLEQFQSPAPFNPNQAERLPFNSIDDFIVPTVPGDPGYFPNREGQRCFVVSAGQGRVNYLYIEVAITISQTEGPPADSDDGSVVITASGSLNPNGTPKIIQVRVDGAGIPTPILSPTVLTTLHGLAPGPHTITAWEDGEPSGTAEKPVVIPQQPPVVVSETVTPPSIGGTTGSIHLEIAGGRKPFTVAYREAGTTTNQIPVLLQAPNERSWESGPISANKTYDVVVTDSGRIPQVRTLQITVPPPSPPNCSINFRSVRALGPALGQSNGQIIVSVIGLSANSQAFITIRSAGTGAVPPFTPVQGNTIGEVPFNDIPPGDYTVTIVDSGFPTPPGPPCSAVTHVTVPKPPPSHYTFLPWIKQRLASLATTTQNVLRPTVPLTVETQVQPAGSPAIATRLTMEITGPGDIIGFSPQAVLKTTPVADEQRFSPLKLASVEFKDEDLPWRYSPGRSSAAASTTTDQVVPWLLLLALEEGEYTSQEQGNRPLPVVRIANGPLFPEVATAWLWAHVQVNKKVAHVPAPSAPSGAPVPLPAFATKLSAETFLANELPRDPSLALSRVMCARRLKPNTRYRAFLVPAFETGRLAGLGQPVVANSADQLAWGVAAAAVLDFPVYHQWAFQTGAAEDFETLARLLSPVTLSNVRHQLAVAIPLEATPGVPAQQRQTQTTPPQPSSGGVLYKLPMPAIIEPEDGTAPTASAPPADVVNALYQELHAGFNIQTPAGGRPVVTAPFYGRYYASAATLNAPINGIIPNEWKYEVNLDPRYRAIANLGSRVVQENQEEYMQRAWSQVKDLVLVNQNLRTLQFGLSTTVGLRNKHLPVVNAADSLRSAWVSPAGMTTLENLAAKLSPEDFSKLEVALPDATTAPETILAALPGIAAEGCCGDECQRRSGRGGEEAGKLWPATDGNGVGSDHDVQQQVHCAGRRPDEQRPASVVHPRFSAHC